MKFLCAVLVASLALMVSAATKGTCGTNCDWYVETEGDKVKLTINSTTRGGQMTDWDGIFSYAPWWSEWHDKVTKIEVRDVKSIGKYAFYVMTKLNEAKVQDEVETIGDHAFELCIGLTEVKIECKNVGMYAFKDCMNLKKVKIDKKVEKIDSTAFKNCIAIEEYKVDGDNTKFKDKDDCLVEVKSEDNYKLFRYPCGKKVTEFAINEKVSQVGLYAFENAFYLQKLTIPKATTTFSDYALNGCIHLAQFVVDDGNTGLMTDGKALYGKTSSAIATLYKYAAGVKGDSYTIPATVKYIGNLAFEDAVNLKTITLHKDVGSISTQAFKGCKLLETLSIPKATESVQADAFEGCIGLKKITVEEGNKKCKSIDDALYCLSSLSTAELMLLKYPTMKENATEIVIPDEAQWIRGYAFENMTKLTSVVIPANVTSVSENAFYGLPELKFMQYNGKKNPGYDGCITDCPKLTEVCIKKGYESSTFCGIKKLVRCGSSMTIPSFAILAVILAYFARFF